MFICGTVKYVYSYLKFNLFCIKLIKLDGWSPVFPPGAIMHFYMIPNWSYLTFVLLLICIFIFSNLDPPAIDTKISTKSFTKRVFFWGNLWFLWFLPYSSTQVLRARTDCSTLNHQQQGLLICMFTRTTIHQTSIEFSILRKTWY